MILNKIKSCGICNSSSFEELWQLPKLPLTERFGKFIGTDQLSYDQVLVICSRCGHVQLAHQLSPDVLYSKSSYSFRTGQSSSAVNGTKVFTDFLNKISGDARFKSLLDVGGNDLYLAKQLADKATSRCVIDPICSDRDGQVVEGIKVFGRAVEQVKIAEEIERPDVVVCRHTLEHVARPYEVLHYLFENTANDCLFVIEVPCLEGLMESYRFDAVFHQHYHYYDLEALKYLIGSLGGEYIDHKYNYQGSCGGALLIAFRKDSNKSGQHDVNIESKINKIKTLIADYELLMSITSRIITNQPKPIYGYGASLMLATLAYHLKTDFSCLECILDDEPFKNGMSYENLPVSIRFVGYEKPDLNSSFVVTSLENARTISSKLRSIEARRIVLPIIL